MVKIKQNKNFMKWIAFSFPYLASLLSDLLIYSVENIFKIDISPAHEQTIYIIINSLGILFGIGIISNYTHTDNCENYSPTKKGFYNLK
jgi:hypothetical protein